jgi:predicted  nucleic acid-binding Zn-ribbon protein
MKDQVRLLLELQELNLVSKESALVHDDSETDMDLAQKMVSLSDQVRPDILSRFNRLAAHGAAVVAVNSGMCRGCNVAIPQGDMNRMINGSTDPICPHCDRFLNLDTEG